MVPPIGNEPAARATLAGVELNVPLFIPTKGVPSRSCAVTKYCMVFPDATPPLISDRSIVKLNGLELLDASTYFHPSVVFVFVAGRELALVDFLYHRRGLMPEVVSTPVPSVMVADKVNVVRQLLLLDIAV